MSLDSSPVVRRRERLYALMERERSSLMLVTKPANIFYLTGFRGSAGVAILGPSEGVLWVDPRYTLEAKEQATEIEVIEYRGELLKAAARRLGKRRRARVGYEDSHLTCREFRLLAREFGRPAQLKPAGGLIEDLRAVKDADEMKRVRAAAQVTREILEEVFPLFRPGVRELELAAEAEYRMKRKGAEGPAFETIVASGPRAALPHASPSSKPLEPNELVIFDLGAILRGYAADMTRTFYLGQAPQRVRRLYAAVLEAQEAAVASLQPGTRADEVDGAARRVLARRGLARYFTHSTGHGVGLEIHEKPRLGKRDKTRLEAGNVVTAEPGVYLKGVGGIRLEDTLLVGTEGAENLTPATKERWLIG